MIVSEEFLCSYILLFLRMNEEVDKRASGWADDSSDEGEQGSKLVDEGGS